MLRPISCPNCKSALAWYDTANFQIRNDSIPSHIKVTGAHLVCDRITEGARCGGVAHFDGLKLRKRARARAKNKTVEVKETLVTLGNLIFAT